MKKDWELTSEEFDRLLDWLAPERELAAEKFVKLGDRIVKILTSRGCYEAEEVFYEAARRIARKPPSLFAAYDGEPAKYFFGVAHKVYQEWREQRPELVAPPLHLAAPPAEDKEAQADCLEACLQELARPDRTLLERYYCDNHPSQIAARKRLAQELHCTDNALKLRVIRVKRSVAECLKNCLEKKNNLT